MVSSLFGYYNSMRAMQANQAALNIINNNIANMNTEGYSKQRLNLVQNVLNSSTSNLYELSISGGGSDIESISRNRDTFLDTYFRQENSSSSYYAEMASYVDLLEGSVNELNTGSISAAISKFYAAAQQLSSNPSDSVVRNNFIQSAQDVCIKFNQTSDQLSTLRTSLAGDVNVNGSLELSQVYVTVGDLNNKLSALAELNRNIALSSSQGLTPNGLLDQRDLLLDQISEIIPVTTDINESNLVTLKYNNINLVSGTDVNCEFSAIKGTTNAQPAIVQLSSVDGNLIYPDLTTKSPTGKLGAMLDLSGSNPATLNINNMLGDLNKLAQNFALEVNNIQHAGQYIDPSTNTLKLVTTRVSDGVGGFTILNTPASAAPFDIFVNDATLTATVAPADITAANITISNNIINDPYKIAASKSTITDFDPLVAGSMDTILDDKAIGNGANAMALSTMRNVPLAALDNATVEGFLTSLTGKIGVQTQSIRDKDNVQTNIMSQIETKRASATGVNLDEELSDLIRYQRAYEASAKVFSTADQIFKTILGLVG